MAFDLEEYLGVHQGVQERQPGDFRAEIWMNPSMDRAALQRRLDELSDADRGLLSFTAFGVRDFSRPATAQDFTPGAKPYLLTMETWEGKLQYCMPDDLSYLWDPAHARELQASGDFGARYVVDRAVDVATGELTDKGAEDDYLADVFGADEGLDSFIVRSGETEVPGVYMVYEHFTNTMFPVTDTSVIRWQSTIAASFHATQLDVTDRAIVYEDLVEFGDALDMSKPLDEREADRRIEEYSRELKRAMEGACIA